MANKSYNVKPADGWTQVLTTGAKATVRISGYPHTHPFDIWSGPTGAPTATSPGVTVCHHPFEVFNALSGGNIEAFYVRVRNPGDQSGGVRIDVYTDGGTLS